MKNFFKTLCLFSFLGLLVTFSYGQETAEDFASKPTLQWKFQTQAPILASPVIDDGVVYFGGLDSVFYALQLSSGKEVWQFHCKGAVRSSAVIDGNTLYLNGGDGKLYSFDKRNGKVRWTFKTNGEKKYDFADYHHSTPVLLDGVLYFGSGDGNFYAVKAENGTKLWNFQTGDAIHTTPSIEDGTIFFGSFDGYVYALNIARGELIWKFKTVGQKYFPKGEVQGSPAVYGGLVFIGARDFNVYAISQKEGTGYWNRSLPNGWGLVNSIRDSVLYIGTGDERNFFAINPVTNHEYWKRKMEFLFFGGNAYSENMLYVGTTIGKLHGMDARTGEDNWIFTTEGYEKNRLKYFKEDDSYRDDIYSIIKSNEQFLEVEYELGGIFSTPAIQGNRMVITTSEGIVYCLSN